MALDTVTTTNGRLRGRGRPVMATMRATTFVAVVTEGISLALEVMDGAARIQTAAGIGSRQLVVHEAGRLGVRAQSARDELRRLAGGLEE